MNKLFQKKKKTVTIQDPALADADRPDKDEIEKQFEILLDELAIPHGVKRDEMQNWDLGRKWMLLSQKETPDKQKRITKSISTKNVLAEDNPQSYINSLKTAQRDKHLASLKVILTGKELSWALVFLDLRGLECILEILEESVRTTPKTAQKAGEILDCMFCIKALLNSQIGMAKCMERPQFTKSVASVLSCTEELLNSADIEIWEKIFCSALNILAAMCLVPNGHRMVVTAFNKLCEEYDEEERFACILKCIWHCATIAKNNTLTENYYALLLSCISFMNVIINAPHELRMRCALRSSFLAIGGEKVLQEIKGIKDDTIQAQVDTFYATAEDDCAELVGDRGFGEYLFHFYQLVSELQSLTKRAKPSTHQAIFFILSNLNQVLSREDIPTCEFSLKELENQTHQVLLQLLYCTTSHDAEEWIHAKAISDPDNHATAVASLPWMPNSVRTRRNTIIARQFEDSISSPSGLDTSPFLGPPPVYNEIPAELISPLLLSPPCLSPTDSPLLSPPLPPSFPSSPSVHISSPESLSTSPPSSSPISSAPPSPAFSSAPSQSVFPGAPPPPPPSLPAKKSPDTQVTPGIKMKNLQWRKVNESNLQNTIWGQTEFRETSQSGNATSLFTTADYKLLEELFAENSTSVISQRTTAQVLKSSNGHAENAKKSHNAKITLLDSKRSNNIAIMLSKFKISPSEIASSVENMDSSKLSSDQLGQMLKLLPTSDEMSLLANVSEQDKSNLGKPELYLLEIMNVPKLSTKLECWHFSLTFNAKVAELKENTSVLTSASKQLMNSKKFSQLLMIILQLGNFINAGGFRGSAAGIKLDCLTKLREVKAGDKRQTLLHFLVNFCLSKHPDLISFFEEISFVEEAKNVSMQSLQADYSSLCSGFSNLDKNLSITLAGEPFAQKLNKVAGEAKTAHESIKTEFVSAQSTYESALSFFGEDATSPEEFFGNIYRFHTSFTQVLTEINRINKTTAPLKKIKSTPGSPSPNNSPSPSPRSSSRLRTNTPPTSQFLDNIIHKIHDSKIFKNRTNISEIMVDSITPRSLFVSP